MSCFRGTLVRIRGKIVSVLIQVGERILTKTERIGGIRTSCVRYGGELSVQTNRQGGIQCRMGLICRTDLGDYEVLWSSEHMLMTIEGKYLITEKR